MSTSLIFFLFYWLNLLHPYPHPFSGLLYFLCCTPINCRTSPRQSGRSHRPPFRGLGSTRILQGVRGVYVSLSSRGDGKNLGRRTCCCLRREGGSEVVSRGEFYITFPTRLTPRSNSVDELASSCYHFEPVKLILRIFSYRVSVSSGFQLKLKGELQPYAKRPSSV